MTQILTQTSTGETLSLHTFTYNGQDLRAQESLDGSAIPPAPAIPETNTTYTTNDVNQLLSTLAPDRTFVYDLDGNMTQGYTKDGYVFTASYDAENRMTSMQYTDSSSVLHRQEFAYSGDGLVAIERTYENGTLVSDIRIMRNGMLPILDKDGSTNATLRQYTWGLNLGGGIGGLLHLYSASAGQNYAYLYDGKGNVEAMLDNSESVVAAYRYDPFGILLANTGSLEQPFGFSTKRYNAPVGMIQYEYRNYIPELGRWTTRDPLGEAGGLNLYAFVGNNPVNWFDPWGLFQSTGLAKAMPWSGYVDAGMTAFENGQYVTGSIYMLDSLVYAGLLVAPAAMSPAVQGAVSSCSLGPAVAEASEAVNFTRAQARNIQKIKEIFHNWTVRNTLSGDQLATHRQKIEEGARGLMRARDALQKSLLNPNLDIAARKIIDENIRIANDLINRAHQLLQQ